MCYNMNCHYQHHFTGECSSPAKFSKYEDAACHVHTCECGREIDRGEKCCEGCKEREEGE